MNNTTVCAVWALAISLGLGALAIMARDSTKAVKVWNIAYAEGLADGRDR
ncbi:MAG: hypothetical protein ACOH10_12550 [Rhodoglobus sp.]